MQHVFKINGVQCIHPTSITYGLENLHTEDSGRSTLTGIMIMKILRKNVRNYTLNWILVDEEEGSKVFDLLQDTDFIDITIHDVLTNTDATFKYYTGGLQANTTGDFPGGHLYYSLSVNLIQR